MWKYSAFLGKGRFTRLYEINSKYVRSQTVVLIINGVSYHHHQAEASVSNNWKSAGATLSLVTANNNSHRLQADAKTVVSDQTV